MSILPRKISSKRRHEHWQANYGPWALVTGASDGIGRAMATSLADAGLNLVLVARRRALLEQLAADLKQHDAIEAVIIDADLSNDAGVSHVLEASAPYDIGLLVACAGFGTSGRFLEASLPQELNMLDVNCRAVLSLSYHFGKRFAQRGCGGIVLMGSLLAFQGVPQAANYAATKAYIQTLAEGLHTELAPLGVDVIASAPGPIQSGFAVRADMKMSLAAKPESVAQVTLEALGRKTTVRPGWLSKALEASLTLLPRGMRVRVMAQIMKGMTQHQNSQPTRISHETA